MEQTKEKEQKQRGQSLIEMALLIPILLILLAGVLDLGRLYFSYVAVTDAASEGATYGAIKPADTAGIINRTLDSAAGIIAIDPDLVEVDCPTYCPSCPTPIWPKPGDLITVTVTYDFQLMTPFMSIIVPDGTLTLRAEATEVIVEFVTLAPLVDTQACLPERPFRLADSKHSGGVI